MSMDAEALLRSQYVTYKLQSRIVRTYKNLKKSGAAKMTAGMESRLKALEASWSKFEDNHEAFRTMYWKAVCDHDYTKKDCSGSSRKAF